MMSHSTIALDPVLFCPGPLTIRWAGVPEKLPALAVWGIMCGLGLAPNARTVETLEGDFPAGGVRDRQADAPTV